ncbi:MAG TPA: hypothetical protein PLB26_00465 [Rubrivivax sp.]|nr:hypothetical protein [Rubrivivax sp.]
MLQDMVNDAVDAEIASEVVGPAAGGAVALLDPLRKIEAGLAALAEESATATWDVETAAGEAAAREFRARCVKVRTSAKAAYELGNKPLLDAQRQARELVGLINAAVDPVESLWDGRIKAKEERKAREKAEREQAERERVAAIRRAIDAISAAPAAAIGCTTAAQVDAMLASLEQTPITEGEFGEFLPEAEAARLRSYDAMLAMRRAAEAREAAAAAAEAEAARLRAEREELERQQAELAAQHEAMRAEQVRQQQIAEAQRLAAERAQAERIAAERAEQARLDAEARARREAEAAELKRQQDAFEEERRIAREQIAAEQRKQREIEAARKAEGERILAERAAAEKAEAERLEAERQAAEAIAKAQAPAAQRPDDEEILHALCAAFGVPAQTALEWVAGFDVVKQHARIVSAQEAA